MNWKLEMHIICFHTWSISVNSSSGNVHTSDVITRSLSFPSFIIVNDSLDAIFFWKIGTFNFLSLYIDKILIYKGYACYISRTTVYCPSKVYHKHVYSLIGLKNIYCIRILLLNFVWKSIFIKKILQKDLNVEDEDLLYPCILWNHSFKSCIFMPTYIG